MMIEPVDFARPGAVYGPGPWADEPGRLEWEHAGFPCVLLRNSFGAWCGYVAVPLGHPWHGMSNNVLDVDVHGGLTCATSWRPGQWHLTETDDEWWLGFDCDHFNDLAPWFAELGCFGGAYRTMDYAKAETESLAEQAARPSTP